MPSHALGPKTPVGIGYHSKHSCFNCGKILATRASTKRFPALGLGVSLAVLTGGASSALANSSLSLGWRATERRILVNYGSGDEPSNFQKFLHDDNSKSTVRNSYQEWARFDLAADTSLGQHFKLGTRLSGGRSRLKLAAHDAPLSGQDYLWDVSSSWKSDISQHFNIESVVGIRLRKWWFQKGRIPSHGNLGLLIGVKPLWDGISILVEATLSAVSLGKQSTWGAQMDSSALRIRPEFEFTSKLYRPFVALEYFHSHTEFFGSKIVENEDAVMLDDYDLAAILGIRLSI